MRISTQSFFDKNLSAMNAQQQRLFRTQQQLGAVTRYINPSDDPAAASRAVSVEQSIANTTMFTAARNQAVSALSQEEQAIKTATTILQNVKSLLVQAGNGTLSDADRRSVAASMESSADQLFAVANSTDGSGRYLFGGYQSSIQPFVRQPDGSITYVGDQGQRLAQVEPTRQVAIADDGRTVFQTVQNGAGYIGSADAGNKGSAMLGAAAIVDTTAPSFGEDFVLSFSGDQYQAATDTKPPVLLATGTYVSGRPITFGGVSLSVSGTPADGDKFSVQTARSAGGDLFAALRDTVTALKQPLADGGAVAQAKLANTLRSAGARIDNGIENLLTVRSSIGARMQELDMLGSASSGRELLDRSYLSQLRDLDYASAISEFSQRKTALEATQQTFARLQGLNLFNFL